MGEFEENDSTWNDQPLNRGDILFVDMGIQPKGSIQGGLRPVVVISNNLANKFSPVVTVVPLSTKIKKKRNLPTHVFVPVSEGNGLGVNSIALGEQVTALDRSRIIEKLGTVDETTLIRITEAVKIQVGVYNKYNRQ